MTPFELDDALKSFRIIVDTREHNNPRASKRYESFGVPVERATLSYGDYCANVDIDGKALLDTSITNSPSCVIERKMGLDELAANFTRGRKRFQREFERAAANNARVYLLVENASWEAIMKHRYRSKYHPKAFMASITAYMVRYGMVPVFCKSDSSGEVIKEILYRDIKERLVNMDG